jgi:hypothetical protein
VDKNDHSSWSKFDPAEPKLSSVSAATEDGGIVAIWWEYVKPKPKPVARKRKR